MSTLHTDHYFRIGNMHVTQGKPCQDYARSGVFENTAYAIVSDGCSRGGNTDIGSRLIVLGTEQAIKDNVLYTGLQEKNKKSVALDVKARAQAITSGASAALSLHEDDMLATRLYVYISPTCAFANIEGDGVVAIQYQDGRLDLHRFEWEDNTPFYPAYRGERLNDFVVAHGGVIRDLRFCEERCLYEADGSIRLNASYRFSMYMGIDGMKIPLSNTEYDLVNIACVGIFSDGITQIEGVDWRDAVRECLAFKSSNGVFLKRRMIRGLKKYEKEEHKVMDDIAGAVIRIENK